MTKTTESSEHAPFWEHVNALRSTILRIMTLIALGMVLSFFFYSTIISFLTSPLNKERSAATLASTEERIEHIRLKNDGPKILTYQLPHNLIDITQMSPNIERIGLKTLLIPPESWVTFTQPINSTQLVVLGPLEGMLIAFKTSLWVGALVTSPLCLLILFQFISPGLHAHERRLVIPFIMTSLTLMLMGALFAFNITIPLANQYLSSFNQAIGINLWSLEHYLDYTFFLLFASSLAFELGVIGIFAVHLGIVSAEKLRSNRRIAILMAFVIGALLTPPDVFTQMMLAIPMILLYEIVILYARFKNDYFTCT